MRVTTNLLLGVLLAYSTVSSLLMQRYDLPTMPGTLARMRMGCNALCVLALVVAWTAHFVGPGRALYYGAGFALWFLLLVPRFYYAAPPSNAGAREGLAYLRTDAGRTDSAATVDVFYAYWIPGVLVYLCCGLFFDCLPWRFVPKKQPRESRSLGGRWDGADRRTGGDGWNGGGGGVPLLMGAAGIDLQAHRSNSSDSEEDEPLPSYPAPRPDRTR